ncbi:MAG: hypothetical protein QXZ25_06665 [Candidatus Bathyarchaeia archaeon]
MASMDSSQRILLKGLSLVARREGPWWNLIPQAFRLIFPLTLFLAELFILAVFIYLAGLIVVGGKKALLSDAFLISLLGTVSSTVLLMFIPYRLIALIISIVVWLLLIKGFYETGWLGAIAVGVLTVIISVVITIVLALIFGIIGVLWEFFL